MGAGQRTRDDALPILFRRRHGGRVKAVPKSADDVGAAAGAVTDRGRPAGDGGREVSRRTATGYQRRLDGSTEVREPFAAFEILARQRPVKVRPVPRVQNVVGRQRRVADRPFYRVRHRRVADAVRLPTVVRIPPVV